jgi:hypothetical protein
MGLSPAARQLIIGELCVTRTTTNLCNTAAAVTVNTIEESSHYTQNSRRVEFFRFQVSFCGQLRAESSCQKFE